MKINNYFWSNKGLTLNRLGEGGERLAPPLLVFLPWHTHFWQRFKGYWVNRVCNASNEGILEVLLSVPLHNVKERNLLAVHGVNLIKLIRTLNTQIKSTKTMNIRFKGTASQLKTNCKENRLFLFTYMSVILHTLFITCYIIFNRY